MDLADALAATGVSTLVVAGLARKPEALRASLREQKRFVGKLFHPDMAQKTTFDVGLANAALSQLDAASDEELQDAVTRFLELYSNPPTTLSKLTELAKMRVANLEGAVATANEELEVFRKDLQGQVSLAVAANERVVSQLITELMAIRFRNPNPIELFDAKTHPFTKISLCELGTGSLLVGEVITEAWIKTGLKPPNDYDSKPVNPVETTFANLRLPLLRVSQQGMVQVVKADWLADNQSAGKSAGKTGEFQNPWKNAELDSLVDSLISSELESFQSEGVGWLIGFYSTVEGSETGTFPGWVSELEDNNFWSKKYQPEELLKTILPHLVATGYVRQQHRKGLTEPARYRVAYEDPAEEARQPDCCYAAVLGTPEDGCWPVTFVPVSCALTAAQSGEE